MAVNVNLPVVSTNIGGCSKMSVITRRAAWPYQFIVLLGLIIGIVAVNPGTSYAG